MFTSLSFSSNFQTATLSVLAIGFLKIGKFAFSRPKKPLMISIFSGYRAPKAR
jgi:hypothetical protein